MEQIRHYFEQITKLSDEDWATFSSKLIKETFPKRSLLLEAGKMEHYLSFIQEGIIRFYIPGEQHDLTFSFAFANEFVAAYDSFLTHEPATYHVEALTDTVLWRLTHDDLQTIYDQTAVGNRIGRHASETLFLKKTKREFSLLHDTAEERYLKLFTEQPHLIRNIPLKYLASYIGITPQALSRIRKRIS